MQLIMLIVSLLQLATFTLAGGNVPSSLIQTTSFPTTNRPNFGNWYVLRNLDETSTSFATLEKDFEAQYIDGQTSVKHLFLSVMTNYSTTTRYSLFIRLTQIFASARSKNYKIIIRAHYIGGEPNDFSIVEQDIQQWIPFLANNTDVLYVVQAGWLGIAFGEWWGTIVLNCTRRSSTTPDLDDGSNPLISYKKSFIVSSLLDLPDNIPISLRSPRDISNYFHGLNRIGFHNDCLLSDGPDGSDTGTYDKSSLFWATGDIKEARSYSMNQIRSLRGGESCPGVYSDTMPCSAILTLVQTYKLSYLNMEFPKRVNSIWQSTDATDIQCIAAITQAFKING